LSLTSFSRLAEAAEKTVLPPQNRPPPPPHPYNKFMEKPAGATQRPFTSLSGIPLEPHYGPIHRATAAGAPQPDLPPPGQFPYTRGIHSTMYRGKLWTMRQFSGFATPEETNRRYRYLLEQGQHGLSVAFDLPTLMGFDADHPNALGEVGKCGVSICSIEDMDTLFAAIPLESVTVSMTINSPAAVIWAMYLVAGERQGASWSKLSGTLQNDILKEYIAQKEYIFPPRPSMRLVTDVIEFAARHTPRFNPISISGYHIREAGSTAVQELAFTLRDGVEYVEWALARGLAIDEFAPRLSFFFNAHNDFFEEIAKYRAARRIWARLMRDRFGARDERSLKCRFHTQTAGCSLTWQQPYNNVVRTTLQALAGVLGGTQSLHTNSLDEAYALPSEQAVTLALRTQQIIAHESNVAAVADPLGGSFYVETLTDQVEAAALEYMRRIDAMGGMIAAVERSYPQSEIAAASYQYQRAIEAGDQIVVGVNAFEARAPEHIDLLHIDEGTQSEQVEKLARLRASRDNTRTRSALETLRAAAAAPDVNTMPAILEAVRASATLGEICDTFRTVFGTWEESSIV
jgi:methylmalonyl-CoA mutase, N-terminal domain